MIPKINITCVPAHSIYYEGIIITPEDTMKDGFKVESIAITNNDIHVMVSAPDGGGAVVNVLVDAKKSYYEELQNE